MPRGASRVERVHQRGLEGAIVGDGDEAGLRLRARIFLHRGDDLGEDPDAARGVAAGVLVQADQRSGRLTRGTVKDILTRSSHHPHGIKVRLTDGRVGRVKQVVPPS